MRDPLALVLALALAVALLPGLALMTSGSAHADAPLVSETADVIGAGDCQVEAALAKGRASNTPASHGWDLLASCGLGRDSQAALGLSGVRSDGSTARAARAVGKTTLVAPAGDVTGWGLRYGFAFEQAPGVGWRSEGLELMGVMTREVASGLLLHANVGHSYSRSTGQGSTLWALGIETTADTTVAADLFGDDRSRPWVSAGVGTKLARGLSINASFAVQFEQPRVRLFTLGAKLTF